MGCTSSKDSKLRGKERSEEQAALLRKILMTDRESQRFGDEYHCEQQQRSRANNACNEVVTKKTHREGSPPSVVPFTLQNKNVPPPRSAMKFDPMHNDHSPITDRSPMLCSITTPTTNCSSRTEYKHVSFCDSVRFNDLPEGTCSRSSARRKLFYDPSAVLPPGAFDAKEDDLMMSHSPDSYSQSSPPSTVRNFLRDDAKHWENRSGPHDSALTSSSNSGDGSGSNDSPVSGCSEDDEPPRTIPEHSRAITTK